MGIFDGILGKKTGTIPNPKDVDAWNNKGIALARQGKYDEAIKVFDLTLEIDPKYAKAWYK